MPQEPKKRHSRQRQGKRRAAIRLSVTASVKCPNCGKAVVPHTVCKYCGFYKGIEVVHIETKEEREKKRVAKSEQESK